MKNEEERNKEKNATKIICGIRYREPRILHPQQLVDLNLSNSNVRSFAGFAGAETDIYGCGCSDCTFTGKKCKLKTK